MTIMVWILIGLTVTVAANWVGARKDLEELRYEYRSQTGRYGKYSGRQNEPLPEHPEKMTILELCGCLLIGLFWPVVFFYLLYVIGAYYFYKHLEKIQAFFETELF